MAEVKQKSIINTKSKLLNESDHKNLFDLFNQGCLVSITLYNIKIKLLFYLKLKIIYIII